MNNQFFSNVVLVVVLNVMIKGFYLIGVEVEVQNSLGPETFGLYLALFNFTYLFQFINDPGLHNSHIAISQGNQELVSKRLGELMWVKLGLGLIYLAAIFLGAKILGYNQEVYTVILLVGINHILSTSHLFLRSNLSASGYYRSDVYLSSLDKVLMIFVIGGMLWQDSNFTLLHFILGQLSCHFVTLCVVGYVLFRKKILNHLPFPESISIYLKQGLPFAIILILMTGYMRIDAVMLERLLPDGKYQAGVYAASYRILEAASMVTYLIAGLLLPYFAAARFKDEIQALIDQGLRIMWVIVSTLAGIGIAYRIEIMSIYDAYDVQYPTLLILHLIGFSGIGFSYVFGTLLTAKRHLRKLNTILIVGLIVNVVLNYIFISQYLAIGAAMTTALTHLIIVFSQWRIVVKEYGRMNNLGMINSILLYLLIFIGWVCFAQMWLNLYWIIEVMILGLLSIIASFYSGLIRKDMIFALLSRKKG